MARELQSTDDMRNQASTTIEIDMLAGVTGGNCPPPGRPGIDRPFFPIDFDTAATVACSPPLRGVPGIDRPFFLQDKIQRPSR